MSSKEEWEANAEIFHMRVRNDIRVLRNDHVMKTVAVDMLKRFLQHNATTAITDMTATVLASIPHDPPRYETMYEVLKVVEDEGFWISICIAYADRTITGEHLPFSSNERLLRHARAVEKVYKRFSLDKIEPLLLDDT